MMYIQLVNTLFKNEIKYVSNIAKTEGEACMLMKESFDFVSVFTETNFQKKKILIESLSSNPLAILP